MNTKKSLLLKYIIILLFTTSLNSAQIDLKAFGTIGCVYNDNGSYIYRKDIFQKDGSSNDLSFETDSVLGLQASLNINENLSFVMQGIAKNDYEDNMKADIDWGYFKYDTHENMIIKIGRIRTPYYKNSENLNIGYSNLMIRESIEVYGQVPFSSYNGAEIIYSNVIDRYFYTLQAGYGKENLTVPIHSLNQKADIKIDDLYAVNLTFGTTAAQFRITYLNADITASSESLNTLFGGLRGYGLNELADKYEFNDKRSEYLGFGIFIDYNNILFSSEYGQRRIPSFFGDVNGYYASLGYSFEKFIPFVIYAKSKMDEDTYQAATPSSDLNILLQAQNIAQSSRTLGFKYFIDENFDIKFQYERVIPKGDFGSYHLSSSRNPQKLNVFSFALDFIF